MPVDRMLDTLVANAQRGDGASAYTLGRHHGALREWDQALQWFLHGARAGHVPSMLEVGFLELRGPVSAPDTLRGLEHLQQAAQAGNGEASLHLAKLMLEGRHLVWNPDQLIDWVMRAHAAGEAEARGLDTLFGADCDVRTALLDWLDPPPLEPVVLRAAPLLAYVDHGLSIRACAILRSRARPLLQPALVYNPHSGQRMQDPTRTNSAAHLGAADLRTVLIEWRLLKRVDERVPLARAEDISVLHYAVGQEYKPHRDYLRPGQTDQFPPHGPGQRTRTAFAYLNTTEAGGETEFPTLGQRIAPVEGRIVVFDNVDAQGQPDPSTLHAALPVIRGEKWLGTLWIRESWVR